MEHTRELITGLAAKLFPAHPPEEILGYLDLYGTEEHELERERVQYCILKLSEGDLDKLISLLDASVRDYRDIIMWAECPPTGVEEAQKMVTKIYERFMKGTPIPDVTCPPNNHSPS